VERHVVDDRNAGEALGQPAQFDRCHLVPPFSSFRGAPKVRARNP
jgi:hypothetical protein